MHFGFMDVILLRNHQHVSATHVDICKNTNNICIHVLTTLQMTTELAGTCWYHYAIKLHLQKAHFLVFNISWYILCS